MFGKLIEICEFGLWREPLICPKPRSQPTVEMGPESRSLQVGVLAGAASFALLLGALAFQYWGGLAPCEMCIWQRWPHGLAAIAGLGGAGLILVGTLPRNAAMPIALLALLGIAASGVIGVYHAGVEWMFWPGPAHCTGIGYVPGADVDIRSFRVVRCDVAQWRLFGISLAGYNALISLGVAGLGLLLLKPRT
jgi:disulfide bond formation protein DsbB